MDYEKKYKEALERAKILYNDKNEIGYANAESVLEEVFPLLKEPEDEKIRKAIIELVRQSSEILGMQNQSNMIAWLENIPYTIDHEKREGFHLGYKAGLEKQCETVWSEETDDDAWLNDIISKVESGCTLNSSEIKWLKSIKDKINIHYWTEEEIEPIISDYLRGAEHYGGMIGRLRCLKPKSLEKQRTSYTKSDVDDAYLKGISDAKNELEKQGEQKPAWSEKDEKEYKYVLKFVDNILNNCGNKKDYDHCKRCYDWLKSLKQKIGG